jgi:acyl-CoA ligase (AMP-forming) (exosortase A-associated)
VAIFLESRIEMVAAVFATSAAGGVFVPINPLLRAQQVSYIIQDCTARVLVTSPERLELVQSELKKSPSLECVVLVGSELTHFSSSDRCRYTTREWAELRDPKAPETHATRTIDLDMAAIFYTSGSTGKPKGVVLSHRNLIVGAESVSSYLGNNCDDVILCVLPLSFDAGFSQVTTAFSVGAHAVLHNYLLPADVVRLCAKHCVTGLTCVPPLWIQLSNAAWPPNATARLRYFANTGGRMPKPTLDSLRYHFPKATPYLMYGLTEAFRSTYLDPREIDRRPNSIGKAIPNAEILVVRPDGSHCLPGEEGELVHRGALVAMGYWNDAARTAERFRPVRGHEQAWRTPELAVYSGDTVVMDDEGFLYFVGRRDEMIKTSGYRVSPSEVEEAAFSTGLVRDAVVLGLHDAALGQRIVLFASPVDSQPLDVESLLAGMKRQLPRYMVPAAVIARDAIPRSPNGKYDRMKLRQEFGS